MAAELTKFTPAEVGQIEKHLEEGLAPQAIAKLFGTNRTTLSDRLEATGWKINFKPKRTLEAIPPRAPKPMGRPKRPSLTPTHPQAGESA